MTAEIINLKRARKTKERAVKEASAAQNRAVFGRSKPEREQSAAEIERAGRALEGARIITLPVTNDAEDTEPGGTS